LNGPLPHFFLPGGASTSASEPYVTGVAQLIANYGEGRPSQIEQPPLSGVDDLGATGNDAAFGAGRVNLLEALSQ
jgi:subtilisin family serine protease